MNVISYARPWNHTRPLRDLEQVFDRLLDPAAASRDAESPWTPAVDIREEDQRYVIEVDLPGVDPASIEMHTDKGVLSLRGERVAAGNAEGTRYTRSERASGSFHRRFTLPESADAERISASGHLGVLSIDIPKRAETTPRRIDIKTIA